MNKHIKECAEVFLRDQGRLFDEPVVFDVSEAEDFLEECFAQYCKNIKELKRVMDDEGRQRRFRLSSIFLRSGRSNKPVSADRYPISFR